MDWLLGNLLALLALGLSGWNTWRLRHRVIVSCLGTSSVRRGASADLPLYRYVVVAVRNVGRPIGVEGITFDGVGPVKAGQGMSIEGLPEDLVPEHCEPHPTPGSGSRRLEDGEAAHWAFVLTGHGYPVTEDGARQFRAVVTLASGRTVRSAPFWHYQGPVR